MSSYQKWKTINIYELLTPLFVSKIQNPKFETKRDSLKSDTDRDMKELEDRLTKKLQRALDNPLAD